MAPSFNISMTFAFINAFYFTRYQRLLSRVIPLAIIEFHRFILKWSSCIFLSRPTLYRKGKLISELSPNELINITRLKKAAELLADSNYEIYEVADMVGYSYQSNFGRNFLKQFGMTPSEYTIMKRPDRK